MGRDDLQPGGSAVEGNVAAQTPDLHEEMTSIGGRDVSAHALQAMPRTTGNAVTAGDAAAGMQAAEAGLKELMQEVFGYSEFRGFQLAVIKSILRVCHSA